MINAANYVQQSADVYTDLASVQSIKSLDDKNLALHKVAEQFESMMLRMMMKSMRSANDVLAEGNYLNSHESKTYRDMLDDQMSLNLVKGRGLGIAEVMVRQLQGRFSNESTDGESRMQSLPERREIAEGAMPSISLARTMPVKATLAEADVPAFDGSIQQFVDHLYPMAEKAAKELGVSPMVLIAQSALETGWGKKVTSHQNGQSSLNFFNIKASRQWQGDSVTVPTLEFRHGLAVKELGEFRSYQSAEESFADYVSFVQGSSRYQPALNSEDAETYIRALADGGYATDSQYAEKVIRIMNSEDFQSAVANVTPPVDGES